MFELARRLVRSAALAAYLSVAPSSVPEWRLNPGPLTVALLVVGEATPTIAYSRGGIRPVH